MTFSPTDKPCFSRRALAHLPDAQQVLFEQWGCGPSARPGFSSVHQAVEMHAARAPEATAAVAAGQRISYGQLNRQANRLAARLIEQGVARGDTVALFVERSIPMLVGLLAVLKIGAAYVPQDARIVPPLQLAMVLETLTAPVILTLSNLQACVPEAQAQRCLCLDAFLAEEPWVAEDNDRVSTAVDPDDLCFVLFTSGTTGRPNGVRVSHRNLCNILLTEPGRMGMAPGRNVGQILNIGFDMAAWEILGCLAHGATLIIRGKDIAHTAAQCDVLIATPSILATLDPQRCPDLKVVAVAGEPCPQGLADRWAAHCDFYNGCGPTETTIVNTLHRHVPGTPLSIGRPTPNNTVYVLDAQGRACELGETGEMWAGGAGVTAGYLGNAELTAQRYRPDPFLGGGAVMFRTRDLGRWTRDGQLEHLGRVDDQVKIRGFCVELDAVSVALEAGDGCARAVALKLDERTLVAFVTPASADIDACRHQCEQRLAYYCMPRAIYALDQLPLTARGKVDKAQLLHWARQRQDVKEIGDV
ncbi:amino acid adenylation domain-containing protein [Pseudomonas extremaustralis]|uniref:amino acid adenylation domain-containing protein n=1 Tax=Pseudomonas extremaustralis TaxID=359110 RepID=UPI0021C73F90|nr:amino acid adenylation domain-containing protein [Pseudomonas extremaustralis]MDG2968111.1 amino acid adenylation domain-containing protein [Pseudomonas extremaustralis]UUJ40245.1 amino acid adenylation domain-containing protein [Pseudomonas extremaustralis]